MNNRLLTTIMSASALFTAIWVNPAFGSGLTEVTLNSSTVSSSQTTEDDVTTKTIRTPATVQFDDEATKEPPLLVTISLDDQALTVFRGTDIIQSSNISSGKEGHDTPTGIFSILGKRKLHRSNIYSSAPMPFMQRLTWSGIALHESRSVPAYPASHGCVRIPKGFAKKLYGTTPIGTHVIISREALKPSRVDHPSLFQPIQTPVVNVSLRKGISDYEASLGIGLTPLEAEKSDAPLRIYVTRATRYEKVRHLQSMLQKLGLYEDVVDGLYGPATIRTVKNYQKNAGLRATGTMTTELVSSLEAETGMPPAPSGMIYVRQNQKQIFKSPVRFRELTKPLGTHLFLATALTATSAQWIGVDIGSKIPASIVRDNEMDQQFKSTRFRADADDALDNIVIPDEARKFIEARLTNYSSYAISDNGLGTETGNGTDFIVQTH